MKHLIVLVLLTASFTLAAQPGKGGFLISGGISYDRKENTALLTVRNMDDEAETVVVPFKTQQFSFTPRVGYFITDGLCAGLSLPASYSNTKFSNLYFPESTSRSIGAGPFARYYLKLDQKLFALAEAGYTWKSLRTKEKHHDVLSGQDTNVNAKTTTLTAGAGLAYFINKNVGIELLASYTRDKHEHHDNADSGFTLEAGFQFYLARPAE